MLKNLPIGWRLTLMLAVMIGALAFVVAIAIDQLYGQLLTERKRHTRQLVEVAYSSIESFHAQAVAGEISEEVAKERALTNLNTLRYDDNNYFWINNLKGVTLTHPQAPALIGKVMPEVADRELRELFVNFLSIARQQGEGFHYYRWPKPGNNTPVEKISYVKLYQPWGWVIGSGMYLDDVKIAGSAMAGRLLAFTGLATLIALVMAWLLRQSISPPLRAITDTMMKLAKGEALTSLPIPDRADEVGELMRALIVFQQTREEAVALRRARDEEARIAQIVYTTIGEAVLVTDGENRIRAVNPAFFRTTGYSAEEVIGQNPKMLGSGYHEPEFYQNMWRCIREYGHWSGEIWNRRRDGTIYPEALSIHAVRDEDGKITEHVAIFSDISERKTAEIRMRWQAEHDPLTGLANRETFINLLSQALGKARVSSDTLAVLFIDLDYFKEINDSHGHAAGDAVLREIANRLRSTLRSGDQVARLGGDEFTVILYPLACANDATLVATKLLHAVTAPISLGQTTLRLGASIGIALAGSASESPAELLAKADAAMYRAKSSGRMGIAIDQNRELAHIDAAASKAMSAE